MDVLPSTLAAFSEALNSIIPGWKVTERGIEGPEGALVRLAHRHELHGRGHVDVQFVFDAQAEDGPERWDCVGGFGETRVEIDQTAAHIWASTTAGSWLELKYSRRGKYADHYQADDSGGLRGWHVIAGAIIGYGHGSSAKQLQTWLLEHPPLPILSEVLTESLDEEHAPHGIKIIIGGTDTVEVQLNGEKHEGATKALEALDWPRLEDAGFVRTYYLAVHAG